MTERLDQALGRWVESPSPAHAAGVYAALLDDALLLPVRATVVSEQVAAATGLPAEKEAELSLLTVALEGGRQVLPVFTSPAAMRRWRIEARPVQVSVRDACRAAIDEGWTGLVIDPGSHDFAVGHAAMLALADGFAPVAGAESMSLGRGVGEQLLPAGPVAAPAEVMAALRRALAREPAVAEAWLLQVQPSLQVGLVLRTALDGAALATVTARLAGRLGRQPLSVAALDPDTAAAAAQRCVRLWP